jgi:hypothetical protein
MQSSHPQLRLVHGEQLATRTNRPDRPGDRCRWCGPTRRHSDRTPRVAVRDPRSRLAVLILWLFWISVGRGSHPPSSSPSIPAVAASHAAPEPSSRPISARRLAQVWRLPGLQAVRGRSAHIREAETHHWRVANKTMAAKVRMTASWRRPAELSPTHWE